MQSARLSTEIVASQSAADPAGGRSEADVDGLAGFPTTDTVEKPEQLNLDFGDEMSLFTRMLLRETPAPVSRTPAFGRIDRLDTSAKVVARADVSAQELEGLFRTTGWGR